MTQPLHPTLEKWRQNVGASVALDAAPALTDAPNTIDVLSWNVAIGKGRLQERIGALVQTRAQTGMQRPLVVLVQEAFRADATVPDVHRSEHHGGQAPRDGGRENIADVARALKMSLRYVPSMRNGTHRSDRGNAILSSVEIAETHEITLPFVRQHRAAIAVRIPIGATSVWFCTAHLDTHGRHRPHPLHEVRRTRRGFGAGRAAQAAAIADALCNIAGPNTPAILAGDFNSYLGLRDPAIAALMQHGFRHSERVGRWRHTFHGPLRLMLDHVMFQKGTSITGVQVRRLDEGLDRSRRIFGSDHHPLLATVTLR